MNGRLIEPFFPVTSVMNVELCSVLSSVENDAYFKPKCQVIKKNLNNTDYALLGNHFRKPSADKDFISFHKICLNP